MLTFCALSCGLLEDRAMAQVVSRRHPSAEARVLASLCDILVDKVALGQAFPLLLRFSAVVIVPPWPSILIYHLGDEHWVH
jgi:hypothetical protein